MEHKEPKTTNQNKKREESKKKKKKEETVRSLWDNFKHSNIHFKGMPEREEQSKKLEIYLKNNESKLPWFGEGNTHADPGSTESQTRWMQRGPCQDVS